MPDIYELQGLHRNCIGSSWALSGFFVKYPDMHMNVSYPHRYEFIEYNLFPFWFCWWMIPSRVNELNNHRWWMLLARKNMRFRGLRIVGCTRIS